jgi:hypothetical protein
LTPEQACDAAMAKAGANRTSIESCKQVDSLKAESEKKNCENAATALKESYKAAGDLCGAADIGVATLGKGSSSGAGDTKKSPAKAGACKAQAEACRDEELKLRKATKEATEDAGISVETQMLRSFNSAIGAKTPETPAQKKKKGLDCSEITEAIPNCPILAIATLGDAKFFEEKTNNLSEKKDTAEDSLKAAMDKEIEANSALQKTKMDAITETDLFEKGIITEQDKINAALTKALSDSTKAKLAHNNNGRTAYSNIDKEYISLRDKAKRVQSSIGSANDNLVTQCRAEAKAKYDQKDQERNALIKQLASTRQNLSSATIAGATRRAANRNAADRKKDYSFFLEECMSGVSAVGANGINAIQRAERERGDLEKNLADQAAFLEKSRLDLLQSLNAEEAILNQDELQAKTQATKAMSKLTSEAPGNRQRLQQRLQNAIEQATAAAKLAAEHVAAKKAKNDAAADKLNLENEREQCAKTGGNYTKDEASKILKDFTKATDAIDSFQDACTAMQDACSAYTKLGGTMPATAAAFGRTCPPKPAGAMSGTAGPPAAGSPPAPGSGARNAEKPK